MGYNGEVCVPSNLISQIQNCFLLGHSWNKIALLNGIPTEITLPEDLIQNGSLPDRVKLLLGFLSLLRASHSLLEAHQVRVLDQFLVANNLVNGLYRMERLHLLRSAELFFSLAVFGLIVLLVI